MDFDVAKRAWMALIFIFFYLPLKQDITSSLPFHRISLDKIEENNAIDQDLQVTCTLSVCLSVCSLAILYLLISIW